MIAGEASKSVSTELPLPSTPEGFEDCRRCLFVKVVKGAGHMITSHHSNYAHRGMCFTATLPESLQNTARYTAPPSTSRHDCRLWPRMFLTRQVCFLACLRRVKVASGT